MARRNWRYGAGELRSLFPLQARLVTGAVRRLLPELPEDDLLPAPSGVRAQAFGHDGSLVDDFVLTESQNAVHVLNAPSPAATSSLPIARLIVDRVPTMPRP